MLLFELTLPLSKLLLREVQPVAESNGAVHGCTDAVVAGPGSLQIRIAPRRFRLCPGFGRGRAFGCLRKCRLRREREDPSYSSQTGDSPTKSVSHNDSPFEIPNAPMLLQPE